MTFPTRYRAEPAPNLIVRLLDDITLIHHRRSGQTHIVVSPVPEILAAMRALAGHDVLFSCESRNPGATEHDSIALDPGLLLSQEHDAEVIVAYLSKQFDLGDPADACSAIEAHLIEMAALGLVHRA